MEIMQCPECVLLQHLLAGGQLQHDRSIFSKQGVDCLCDVIQGEGHRLKGRQTYTSFSLVGFVLIVVHFFALYQTYILQWVGSHILWE